MTDLSRTPVIDLLTELARRPEVEMQDTIAALIAIYHRATDPEEAVSAIDGALNEMVGMQLDVWATIPIEEPDPAWRTR